MPRISYRPYEQLDERSQAYLNYARDHGTPRPESQAVRAHVPEGLRVFTEAWRAAFENGVLDNATKELCRLYVSKTVDCEYCGTQRSELARAVVDEPKIDEIVDFERSARDSERAWLSLPYGRASHVG